VLVSLAQEAYSRHQKDMDTLQFRLTKLQQEFESQLNTCDQLNTENQNRALELKVPVACAHTYSLHGGPKNTYCFLLVRLNKIWGRFHSRV